MILTRQKARAGTNPESPARTQPVTNIREVRNPVRTVFTQEQNDLLIQQLLQYCQEEKSDELHYLVIGLNQSSTEDDMKTSYRYPAILFYPDKNHHSKVSDVIKMINESKEKLESTLCHNYEKWKKNVSVWHGLLKFRLNPQYGKR